MGLDPTDRYAAIFGAGPDVSLVDALRMKGGKFNALVRQSAAALLNAVHPDVSYDLGGAEIIAGVQAAYDSGAWESFKDDLDAFNNQGCPLN